MRPASRATAYSGKFTPNPALIGTWAWAAWPQPNNPSEIDERIANFMKSNHGKGPDKIENPKDVIQFLDDGKLARSRFFRDYFWSGNMLVGINDDQALKFDVRTVSGRDFLVVERRGFNAVPQTEEEANAWPMWASRVLMDSGGHPSSPRLRRTGRRAATSVSIAHVLAKLVPSLSAIVGFTKSPLWNGRLVLGCSDTAASAHGKLVTAPPGRACSQLVPCFKHHAC